MKKLLTLWSLLLLVVVGVNAQTVSDEYLDIANYAGVLDGANAKEGLTVGAYDSGTQTLVVNAYSAYQSNAYQKWQTQTKNGSASGKTWNAIGEFKGNSYWNDQHAATTVVKDGDERYYSYRVTGVATISAYVKSGSNGRDVHLAVYKLNNALERGELVGSDQERVNAATILSVCGLDKSQKYEAVVYGSSSGNSEFYEISFSAGNTQAPIVSVMDYNTIFGTAYTTTVTDKTMLSGTKCGVKVTMDKAEGANFYVKDYEIRLYPKNTLTFSAPDGYVIEKIVLAVTENADKLTTGSVGSYDSATKTWTGESKDVVFTSVESMTSGKFTIKTTPTYVYLKKGSASTQTYTAKFKNTVGWDNVYAYTFNPETLGGWPGKKMEEVDGVLTISFDAAEAPANIIFNNGSGGEGNQTADLEFVDGQLYDFGEAPSPATYTVAGNSEALFGTAWSPSTEANDMVANPEVENEYVFTKENVTLEVGTIEYKVVENHAWVVAYPASNAELVIDAAGAYNVKITFNSETKAVNGTATAVTPPAPVEFNKWVVAGSSAALNGKSWDKAATENLMTTTDGKNYELVVTDAVLEKGTNYECKVVLQPTKENPTDDDYIWRPSNNVVFTTGEAETGKYTVTYTYVAPDNIETEEGTLTVATVRTGDADPVEKTYTVAGNSEALFGSTWSAASESNDMVANPEVENEYVFEKENVALTAGTILYKVVENHSWDVSYPTNNAELVIDADGTYNVKFTFNSETKAVNGTATAVTPPAPEIDKLYVIGDGTTNGWDRTAMDEMTYNEDTQTFTYQFAPATKSYIAIADYQMTAEEAAADQEWTAFAQHRYFIDGLEADASPELGTEYDLTKGNANIVLAAGTYTLTVKNMKITITGEVAPPPAEDTYVVAGSGPATNGVVWDGTAEVNKMTTTDKDTYTLVVENVELKAGGDYQWKVVKNGNDWIPSGTDNNLTIDFTEDAIYTVTYKYVVSTGEETATVEKTGDLPVPAEKTYTVAGAAGKDMESGIDDVIFGKTWNPAIVDNDMTKGDDGIYRLEKKDVELGITTVEFKVCVNHDWNESYGVGEGNAECEIAESGIYTITFTFNPETQAVNATAVKTGGGGEPVDGINSVSVFFDDDTPIYNLAGQRVTTPRQGVFIKNGKKFIVK